MGFAAGEREAAYFVCVGEAVPKRSRSRSGRGQEMKEEREENLLNYT